MNAAMRFKAFLQIFGMFNDDLLINFRSNYINIHRH